MITSSFARVTRDRLTALALAGSAGLALAAAPLGAQGRLDRPPASSMVELAPYAGYMMLGDFVRGPYGTDVSGANGLIVGAQLAFKLTPNIALVGNLARASGDLEVGVPIIGGFDVGSADVWLYDAGIQLGVPATSRGGVGIAPFVQAGAGAMHHTVSAAFLKTDATNFAANVGVGADLMLGRSVGLRLLARDYIGRFDVEEATSLGMKGETSHNFALSAGLKLQF